jgi:hypothetical protein
MMEYRNTELNVDTIIGLFRDGRINLSPVFQRGRAWPLRLRQELIKNVARGRPIPAIFLYKTARGNATAYTVMDGKQRLESLLLFIADGHKDLKINTWKNYFADHAHWGDAGFAVRCRDDNNKLTFAQLSDDEIRAIRDYVIPIVEITLEDETNLDEIITLFVDINKNGKPVLRDQIVAAMKHKDELLRTVYELVAQKLEKGKMKGKDRFTRIIKGPFTSVLGKLTVVSSAPNNHAIADRMWAKLMEFALFTRNGNTHGKGADVLKRFVETENNPPLSSQERKVLRRVFQFLESAYRVGLSRTKVATDYSHFYIVCTTLLSGYMFPNPMPDQQKKVLIKKLIAFGKKLDVQYKPEDLSNIAQYQRLSSKQTTDARKRGERQVLLQKILGTI